MNICILSTDQEDDDNRILEAALEKGHKACIYRMQDIRLALSTHQPCVYAGNEDITDKFDVIIPRLNVNCSDYGINVLQQFICSQIYVSETPDALRLGRDKLKCLQYLLAQGLPFPTTCISYRPEGFSDLARHTGLPVVVKLIDSTEGVGVFVVNTRKELDNLAKTFTRFGASYVIQSFIGEAAGSDVRAFVVGGRVVAAMERHSIDGDFRANVSLGATADPCELSEHEEKTVLAATEAIGINVAGVDFIRSKSGPLLLEINVSPDFTGDHGIEKVTGIDIAGAIVDFVVQQTQPFYANHRLLQMCNSMSKEG
ncbi:RimK family alpha-L-glutamate ligase [Aliidiomarina sedimenti]|uniref:RimK family alpha-L-glutamate ligase n=1 Tax=Aliidiomarina sedimenti TaxID=1933879 RepID=A0ABY0C0Z1_9GAMM|nr:RimK family alpha-L-glutamate ligase [Aliidiomarina sedimenti]RUO30834.1 RimK family alpha-L-glutamate ligase [Aliidiomarina sedimenti]